MSDTVQIVKIYSRSTMLITYLLTLQLLDGVSVLFISPKSPSADTGNLRLLSISIFFFPFLGHHFVFSGNILDDWIMQKTAISTRRIGSHCARNARQKKAYKVHFNPDWVKEWPTVIAKSHKGDTYAFCRLCRCDFSVSSGDSKTCSVTSLIVTRYHH